MKRVREAHFVMLIVALAFAWAGGAAAETEIPGVAEPPAEPPAAVSEPEGETLSVNIAGLQVAIDAETGRMRPPTADEAAKLAAGLRKMLATHSQVRSKAPAVDKSSGVGSMVLGMDFLKFSVLKIDDDGTLSRSCVDSPESAREFVEQVNHGRAME